MGFQFQVPDLVASSPFDGGVNPRTEQRFLNYGPVTSDSEYETVPWETWTYTQLRGGVEFTFTDEVGNGHFDFAPLPPLPQSDNRIASVARMMEYAPGVIYQQAIAVVPDYPSPGRGQRRAAFFLRHRGFSRRKGQDPRRSVLRHPPGRSDHRQGGFGLSHPHPRHAGFGGRDPRKHLPRRKRPCPTKTASDFPRLGARLSRTCSASKSRRGKSTNFKCS